MRPTSLSPTAAPAQPAPAAPSATGDGGTRDRVARLLLETGPLTAAALAARLGVSPAAIRRHLDALVERGSVVDAERRGSAVRGRGRPARVYALTDAGRAEFPHAYDDLASTALRYLDASGGAGAVEAFACFRTGELERKLRLGMSRSAAARDRAVPHHASASPERGLEMLAEALTAEGYAASVQRTATGAQLCQHDCPVSHVAQQFGQLCEAETRMFERLLGTHVQRLATLAHGDGVCTTFVPDPQPVANDLGSSAHADPAEQGASDSPASQTTVRPGGMS